MKKKVWLILGILVFLIGVFSFRFGSNILVSEMLLFLDSLLIVSAIIFGIVGAWLAVTWQNTSISRQEQNENISYLKMTVLCAFIVIFYSLAIKFLYPIFKDASFLSNENLKHWIKICFVFTTGISFLLLVFSLFLSLLSFDFFSYEKETRGQLNETKNIFKKKQLSQVNKNNPEKTVSMI